MTKFLFRGLEQITDYFYEYLNSFIIISTNDEYKYVNKP